MSQYSQWLHHHKIDQQLQAQRARLEQDLRNHQEQAHSLEVHNFHAPNTIIQALQQHMHTEARLTALSPDAPSAHHLHHSPEPEPSTSTAMPAVRPRPRWTPIPGMIERNQYTNSKLPIHSMALKATQLTPVTATSTSTALQLASNTHIIPTQDTPPQEALTYTGHARPSHRTLPVDPQDERTDQMIRRWLTRWGKYLPNQQIQPNTQDAKDE